ncbi:hypothetical protein ACJ41O_010970 [Fusarium nematophilum]
MAHFMNSLFATLLFVQFFWFPAGVFAGFEEALVAFEPSDGAVELQGAAIIWDDIDPIGINIAVNSLAEDLEQITGQGSSVKAWKNSSPGNTSEPAIIAATVGSPLIRQLESAGKIDAEDIRGKWETFRTTLVADPLPGVKSAFVIAGSDMRAVVFGIYTLSEQCGQSPLHWRNDVPATKQDKIYGLDKTRTFGEPTVKFRGLFINDEAPALTSWWAQRSNSTDYTFDAEFYERVFDLLLRLRANFIWPAMWGSFVPKPGRIFFTDDLQNMELANDYGIVVSASHHEPMQRASNEWKMSPKGEWDWVTNKDNVVNFMSEGVRRVGRNDTYFTLGMRGENDGPIEADDPVAVLEDVFAAQREILARYYGNETAAKQVWTIYKEVATYYAAGLVPPDDPKVYKELYQTAQSGADRIWVINVGDIKPVELPLNLAMDLAWNSSRFDLDTLPNYLESLAAWDFGIQHAEAIASAWLKYSHLVGMRQFETTEPTTYSITNYEESDCILRAWKSLAQDAMAIQAELPEDRRDALYHSLTYAAVVGHNYHKIVLGQGKNRQYSFERRNSANKIAHELLEDFEYDFSLTVEYDNLAGGKWKGIMDVMANLSFVQLNQDFDYGFGNLGIFVEQSRAPYLQGRICASINPSQPTTEGFSPVMRAMEPHGPKSHFIDLFHRGDHRRTISWSIDLPEPWIKASQTSGRVSGAEPEERIWISVDWDSMPDNYNPTVQLRVSYGPPSHFDDIHLPVVKVQIPEGFEGFPETDGIISIEAPHYQRSSSGDIGFQNMPRLGSRSESGSVGLRPYTAAHESEEGCKAAWLDYDFFLFGNSSRSGVNATIYVNGALDTHPRKPMKFSLRVQGDDRAEAEFVRLLGDPEKPGDSPPEWTAGVADHVWMKTIQLDSLGPGKHTLRWQVNSPEVYLEKIVLATQGRLPETYLGPPETPIASATGGNSSSACRYIYEITSASPQRMRLINVKTLQLHEFHGNNIPPYAILSHTWGDHEVTFQDWQNLSAASQKAGFAKIRGACARTQFRGLKWLWVDTNCIDKSSSAELSEAINSMFAYYEGAAVCFVYLSDVATVVCVDSDSVLAQVSRSRWFTRGWTLQELLAPRLLEFFAADWTPIGLGYDVSLSRLISRVTGIAEIYLSHTGCSVQDACVAKKMSWLASRTTTRLEDMAYCMLGIFDINMPLLYGEGSKAFNRLQEEIIKTTNDHTIFCWNWDSSVPRYWTSLLAPSPTQFLGAGRVNRKLSSFQHTEISIFSMTNAGLSIRLPVLHAPNSFFVVFEAEPRDSISRVAETSLCVQVRGHVRGEVLYVERVPYPAAPATISTSSALFLDPESLLVKKTGGTELPRGVGEARSERQVSKLIPFYLVCSSRSLFDKWQFEDTGFSAGFMNRILGTIEVRISTHSAGSSIGATLIKAWSIPSHAVGNMKIPSLLYVYIFVGIKITGSSTSVFSQIFSPKTDSRPEALVNFGTEPLLGDQIMQAKESQPGHFSEFVGMTVTIDGPSGLTGTGDDVYFLHLAEGRRPSLSDDGFSESGDHPPVSSQGIFRLPGLR